MRILSLNNKAYDHAKLFGIATLRQRLESSDLYSHMKGMRAVLVGLPAAFSPVCTERHLPGYVDAMPALCDLGVEKVLVVSGSDAFALQAMGKLLAIPGDIILLSDRNGDFAREAGCVLPA